MKDLTWTFETVPGLSRRGLAWLRSKPWHLGATVGGMAVIMLAAVLGRPSGNGSLATVVRRGDLMSLLSATGTLKPAQSITYRSPLGGRESEITFLVAEGTLVGEGDLLVRLDTTELVRELERAVQEVRQAELDLQVAEGERAEGAATLDDLTAGGGAVAVEETRVQLDFAEKKVQRLKETHESLRPLMQRGFITREELDKSAFEVEQAEMELALARRKAAVYLERTHPRDRKRAALQLSQKRVQAENARARVAESRAHLQSLRENIEACSQYARAPGLVVYEEYLASPNRRKIRVGDRVTGSQGLVTIPEVTRMLVEASVFESDVHRLRPGQTATIRLDAFPNLRLPGKLTRVGTLARSSAERPFEGKRFDVIVEVDATSADLRPEMTARVDILVASRKDALLVPVNGVFEQDGKAVAYVIGLLGTRTRELTLGDTDDLSVEVLTGLEEGDRVSLVDVRSSSPLPAAAAPASAGARMPAAAGSAGSGQGSPLAPP